MMLSLDDFGTGYSSLAYLKRLPIDELKIDQSFIREITTSADDAAITHAIIAMGHSLELIAMAEASRPRSSSSSCAGRPATRARALFSRPLPAAEATRMLREGPPRVAAA